MGGLAAAGNALTIAKALRDVEKSYDAVAYKQQVIDLIDALMDAKIGLSDARDALLARDTEISALKKGIELQSTLVDGDGGYEYRVNNKNERFGYPACPKCLALSTRIVPLLQNLAIDSAKCPICTSSFQPVTCYIPASENAGNETTASIEAARKKSEAMDQAADAMIRINSGSRLFHGPGGW